MFAGIPMLGLDALSSSAYGPEAALTILLPLGAAGLAYLAPITLIILLLLAVLFFSYRQTIAAYPGGVARTLSPKRTWERGPDCWRRRLYCSTTS